MPVAYCALFADCVLVYVVCWSLSVGSLLLLASVCCCCLMVVVCWRCVVCCLLPVVCCLWIAFAC